MPSACRAASAGWGSWLTTPGGSGTRKPSSSSPRSTDSLWDRLYHNPVAFLRKVDRPRLNAVTSDQRYLDYYDRVMRNFDAYTKPAETWFSRTYPNLKDKQIAYFSFEFGLHESLPVYAGGLGILSGDHIKEASDLGLPLIGVGFIYNQGYFTQRITEDGWQETRTYHLNFELSCPSSRSLMKMASPPRSQSNCPVARCTPACGKCKSGGYRSILLDTNLEENSAYDRTLTDKLYSNDLDIRISQEILLGMGGVRALRLLGYHPDVWHMNEGHSAFLALERLRELVAEGKTYEQAAEIIRHNNVFTTHTPVPAGNDQFPLWLAEKYFTPMLAAAGPDPRPIRRPRPPGAAVGRILLHAGAGPASLQSPQRRLGAAWRGLAQDVAVPLSRHES